MYLRSWVPAVPTPCSNRSFVFQIYWPPLPGQTEECFRKGKDPGVSPHAGAVLWHPAGNSPMGLAGQLILGQSKGLYGCMRETEAGSWCPSLAM